ncbi:hypothetical protein FZ983_19950 [Azospirillum sp. B21]|uniref:hypothetical protein n=1 Tax=Azospirillum sp. B21 TaxID=2607496 RepID=UPI0011EFC6B2|nr:hypothetical protein [Azospirillum sp. B21]KAA0577865.1 hypothetical protein FZ983_19950 [Azospirillum sp. B21]
MPNLYLHDDRPPEIAASFSGLPNPWAAVQTYDVFPSGEVTPALRDAYRRYGIVKLTNVLSREENARYRGIARTLSGIEDRDFAEIAAGRRANYVKPGIVGHVPDLWPLADHPRIRPSLDMIFGRPFGLINSSVGVNFAASGLHRDGDYFGMDDQPHNLIDDPENTNAQVILSFSPPGRQAARLGIIPFTHQKSIYDRMASEIGLDVPFEYYTAHGAVKNRALATGDLRPLYEIERYVVFIDIHPGEALLFDGRLLHFGELMSGPKCISILSYSAEDDIQLERIHRLLRRHANGGDGDFPPPFRSYLKDHGLFWPRMEETIEAALRGRLERLEDLRRDAPVFIYGAGSSGTRLQERLAALNLPAVSGFIDTERSGTFNGLPLHAVADYAALHDPGHQILIASQYYDAIEKTLIRHGIRSFHTVFHLMQRQGD